MNTENIITIAASEDKLETLQRFIEERLNVGGFASKAIMQVLIAVEEIFVNIVNYSGSDKVEISVETREIEAIISFVDSGKPYNPLEKEDPDITLSAKERKQGGLGIYMTKNLTDGMEYEYNDGKNVLRLKKIMN